MVIDKGTPPLKIVNASQGCAHKYENLKRFRVVYNYIILF